MQAPGKSPGHILDVNRREPELAGLCRGDAIEEEGCWQRQPDDVVGQLASEFHAFSGIAEDDRGTEYRPVQPGGFQILFCFILGCLVRGAVSPDAVCAHQQKPACTGLCGSINSFPDGIELQSSVGNAPGRELSQYADVVDRCITAAQRAADGCGVLYIARHQGAFIRIIDSRLMAAADKNNGVRTRVYQCVHKVTAYKTGTAKDMARNDRKRRCGRCTAAHKVPS